MQKGVAARLRQEVEVRLPADRRYVGPLRALVTALAAHCEVTVDEVEDLQIAVDEACALLLPHARPDAQLEVHLELESEQMCMVVSVPAGAGAVPDRYGFSWTVLSAVVDDLRVTSGADLLAIRVVKQCNSATR